MLLIWSGFFILIFLLLALDLGVFNRKAHAPTTKEALRATAFYVFLSLLFSVFVYHAYQNGWISHKSTLGAKDAALKYLTGYLLEESLSLDNIFVIALIIEYFKIPLKFQHRVLFWGILGALIFRGIMIGAGTALVMRFDWIMYVFGVLLLYSAWKMMSTGEQKVEPEKSFLIRWVKKFYPVDTKAPMGKFFSRIGTKRAVTPMFIALLVIESSDIMFAVDSIPAIFAVTSDPFLVFTSNVFAILGLRSLYFVLASVLQKFRFLKVSLVIILAFIGVKMMILHWVHVPIYISLSVVAGMLGFGVFASLLFPEKKFSAAVKKITKGAASKSKKIKK